MNLAFWAFMTCLMNGSIDAKTASNFYLYSTFSWTTFYSLFLHYIIILTDREDFFKRKFALLILYFPALLAFYLYVFKPETAQNFVKTNLGWVYIASTDKGFIWTNFYNVYYFCSMIVIIFLLFTWWKNSEIIRERKQAKLILTTTLIIIMTGGITDIVIPMFIRPFMPSIGIILIIIPIIGIWYSIKKYKLMDLNPQNFALEVLKIMSEGLIIANHEGLIKDVNKGALKLIGYEKDQIKDKLISTLFSETIELSKLANCSSFVF